MKYNNRKFYFQWFAIGILITFICVGFGLYISHYITQNEERNRRELMQGRHEERINEYFKERFEILSTLIETKKFSPEEAFRIFDKSHIAPFPEASFLLDKNKNVIDSHISRRWRERKKKKFQEFKLTPDRYLRIYYYDRPLFKGGRKDAPPRRDALLIGLLTVGVSIITGIGLSLVILTWYLRKKAREAENIMNMIKAGSLSTRFSISQTDEAGLLMLKFNEMADQIENLVMNLKATEESRTKLLQELAHDLRTPVASMRSLQEILFTQEDNLSSDEKKHLQNLATREVGYFQRLVEDLLFLSGVNDPRYGQNMQKVNLTSLIREELEVFDVGSISLSFKAPEEEVFINADSHLLHRLLKNALSNAIRHAKTSVLISLQQEGTKILLKVRDDGPGLKEEDFKTFGEKKFSRELRQDESNYISVGLGSVIMKKIMSLHNGSLSIQNTSPGAELTLTF